MEWTATITGGVISGFFSEEKNFENRFPGQMSSTAPAKHVVKSVFDIKAFLLGNDK